MYVFRQKLSLFYGRQVSPLKDIKSSVFIPYKNWKLIIRRTYIHSNLKSKPKLNKSLIGIPNAQLAGIEKPLVLKAGQWNY